MTTEGKHNDAEVPKSLGLSQIAGLPSLRRRAIHFGSKEWPEGGHLLTTAQHTFMGNPALNNL